MCYYSFSLDILLWQMSNIQKSINNFTMIPHMLTTQMLTYVLHMYSFLYHSFHRIFSYFKVSNAKLTSELCKPHAIIKYIPCYAHLFRLSTFMNYWILHVFVHWPTAALYPGDKKELKCFNKCPFEVEIMFSFEQ